MYKSLTQPRVAIVAKSSDLAESMAKNLSPFGLRTVYKGDDTVTVSEVLEARPNVLLLFLSDRSIDSELLQELLESLSKASPEPKVVLRTSYREDTEFAKTTKRLGVSLIGDCKDWNEVAEVVKLTVDGKPQARCETSASGNNLETSTGYRLHRNARR